jgi:hypothetical protein
MSLQRSSDYKRRGLVETTMFRYKTIIGRRLHARSLPKSADRGESRMQRAQPDDRSRRASLRPDPLTRNPQGKTQPLVYSRANAARPPFVQRTSQAPAQPDRPEKKSPATGAGRILKQGLERFSILVHRRPTRRASMDLSKPAMVSKRILTCWRIPRPGRSILPLYRLFGGLQSVRGAGLLEAVLPISDALCGTRRKRLVS